MIQLRAATIAVLLALTGAAGAQETKPPEKAPWLGFGVGITAFDSASYALGAAYRNSFYIPIRLGNFTIEPEFSGFTTDETNGAKVDQPAFGVGVLYRFMKVEQTQFYGGLRLGFSHYSSKTSGQTVNGDNSRFAPVFGAEHMVGTVFGVGAEAQLVFANIGKVSGGGTTVSESKSVQATAGVIFARFYFL